MKRLAVLITGLIFLAACSAHSPTLSESQFQSAVAGTLTAVKQKEKDITLTPDYLSTVNSQGTATEEAQRTNAVLMKDTASANEEIQLHANQTQNAAYFATQSEASRIKALTPTITPTPPFSEQVQQIGPIWDSLRDSSYSMQITVTNVRWLKSDGYDEPKSGNIFMVVYLRARNLGPGSVRSFGNSNFQALDGNGILHDYELIDTTMNSCGLDYVDMLPDAVLEGCVAFEIPIEGKVEFVYAPYQYEGLEPGRYLSFIVRP